MTENELTHKASPLVARYRQLKAKADDLKVQMDGLRDGIAKAVEAQGDYKDDEGYARIQHRSESVKYDGKGVDKLASTWANSPDPILAQCGELLLKERSVSPGSTYITIK